MCVRADDFAEQLTLRPLQRTSDKEYLFLVRFEFNVEAPLSNEGHDDFDLLPKSIGKLLNAHRAIAGFEATLTRGRWKAEEWGPAAHEVRPPGAVLVGVTNSSDDREADEAWKFVTSTLSGALCASFEGMDPDRPTSSWATPLVLPSEESGHQVRFATLPYEPVCTENLTPWLKLLPCAGHRGLAALLAPLDVAASPLQALSLAVAVRAGPAGRTAVMRASLDVVLPARPKGDGFKAWFSVDDAQNFRPCPGARSSMVEVWQSAAASAGSAAHPERLPSAEFASAGRPAILKQPMPGTLRPGAVAAVEGVAVMRDILSQRGRSERTHGRYLLRFTNAGPTPRRVHFLDQLPFFVQPMWHTFHSTFAVASGDVREIAGREAMQKLSLRFVPSDGLKMPTEVSMSVEVPAGGTVSVFLDVLKRFIKIAEFSFAAEKGFDIGSAAWIEEGSGVAGTRQGGVGRMGATIAETMDYGRLRFTQGLLVMVPMPDFSMPFNVIALSSTAMTFFFGATFRMTAAGRVPHWTLKKEEAPKKVGIRTFLRPVLTLAVVYGVYMLGIEDMARIEGLRASLPPDAAFLVDVLKDTKLQAEAVLKILKLL